MMRSRLRPHSLVTSCLGFGFFELSFSTIYLLHNTFILHTIQQTFHLPILALEYTDHLMAGRTQPISTQCLFTCQVFNFPTSTISRFHVSKRFSKFLVGRHLANLTCKLWQRKDYLDDCVLVEDRCMGCYRVDSSRLLPSPEHPKFFFAEYGRLALGYTVHIGTCKISFEAKASTPKDL